MFRLSRLVGCCLLLGPPSIALSAHPAFALGVDDATAQALFEQGRGLLRAGKTAAACPKLAESERIEPSTGTLLALALCDEADHKLASAWAEFVSVEARARSENRADREQAAHQHAQALRARLSTLEVRVPRGVESLPGVEIRRDGVELGNGAWNVAVPVDGAEHFVEVTAPGKVPWQGSITVKPESDVAVLAVPELEAVPVATVEPKAALPVAPSPAPSNAGGAKRWGALEWAGVSAAGAGVVALGVGGYFLSSALGKKSNSAKDCTDDSCGPQGFSDRTSAVSKGNAATIFGLAGGVLVAGGASLFIVGRVGTSHDDSASAGRGALAFSAGPTGLSAQVSTHF